MKRLVGLVSLLIFVTGCGGPATGSLTGTVTVNGKPLPSGTLILFTESKASLTVGITNGSYSIDKVPIGKAIVAVREIQGGDGKDPGQVDPTKAALPPASIVPKKYEKHETSGLTIAIAKGANKGDFDLK